VPQNVEAWFLVASVLDDDSEKRRYCYERILSIDPQNRRAKDDLEVLESREGNAAIGNQSEKPESEPQASSRSQSMLSQRISQHSNSDAISIQQLQTSKTTSITETKPAQGTIRCPKCYSDQVAAGQKGLGFGKAAAGAVLLGQVGLLGGFWGSSKIKVTCLNCGHQWEPGKS
jgi:hypothetical protein